MKSKPKYKLGQVVQQLDFEFEDDDFYAKVMDRWWNVEERQWEYRFEIGMCTLLEQYLRPLTQKERG